MRSEIGRYKRRGTTIWHRCYSGAAEECVKLVEGRALRSYRARGRPWDVACVVCKKTGLDSVGESDTGISSRERVRMRG